MESLGKDPDVIPVNVPNYFHLSQLLMFCKRFGIFFCKACQVPLSETNAHVHLTNCTNGPHNWEQYGVSQFPKIPLYSAMQDCIYKFGKYRMSPEDIAFIELHHPVEGLEIHDVYIYAFCTNEGCTRGPFKHKSTLRQHLKTDHKLDKNSIDVIINGAKVMKRQFLTPSRDSYIFVDPQAMFLGRSVVYQQHPLEMLAANYDNEQLNGELPSDILASANQRVTEKEAEHARNLTLLETMCNWSSVILPQESDLALWMVRQKHPYLPDNFKADAIEEIKRWMRNLRATLPSLPEYMKCATAAQSKERIEFTAVAHNNYNYPEVMAMFLQWMLLVCQVVNVPWVDPDGTVRDETIRDIPEKWLVTNDTICHATQQLWEHSSNGALDKKTSPEYWKFANAFFTACFAREAAVKIDDTCNYDFVAIFLVAVCNNLVYSNGGKVVVGTCTNKVAALEYAMRGSILLQSKDMYLDMKRSTDPVYTPRQMIQKTAKHIQDFSIPSTTENNVAFLFSYFKSQMRRYGTKDGQVSVQFHQLECLDHTVLYPHEARVLFSELRGGICQALVDLGILCTSLMEGYWQKPELFDLKLIKDNLRDESNDYSFHRDGTNADFNSLWEKWSRTQMHSDPMWRSAFLKKCECIMHLLVFLLHTTSGGPGRSTSMVASKLYNVNGYPRCLQVFEGNLFFATLYQKGQVVHHHEKMTVKCIEPMVAKWLLHYLLLFKPFEDNMRSTHANVKNEVMCAGRQRHLFNSKTGQMTSDEYINILNVHFKKYCKVDLGISGWRHSFTALAEEHVSADDPDKPEELHTGTTVANDQMGHSNAMGAQHYGNTTKNPVGGSKYFAAVAAFSKKWQNFILGKPPLVTKMVDQFENSKAATTTSENVQDVETPKITNNTTNITYQVNITTATTLDGSVFSKLHGSPGISKFGEMRLRKIYQSIERIKLHPTPFQFPGTKKCFDTVCSNSIGDYICVLPTGSGKSSIYQYLSISDLDKTQDVVLVVVPLKELLENQIQISYRMKLPYIRYTRDKHPANMIQDMCLDGEIGLAKRLVFIQVEHIDSKFLEFVSLLNSFNRLCKLVFDEFHLYLIHREIRDAAFHNNQKVIQAISNIGRVFLSATVELKKEQELVELVSLGVGSGRIAPTVLRYGNIPRNMGFFVTKFPRVENCLSHLGSNLKYLMEQRVNKARYIVFVLTVPDMKQVASFLRTNNNLAVVTLHSKMAEEEKVTARREWHNGSKPIMVATVAFSHGVDYEDVPYIVIFRGMYDLSTMLQCAGRGGRGMGTKTVLEVMCINNEYDTPSSKCQTICDEEFCSWVTTEGRCRRNILSHAFYGFTEICSSEMIPCDHCLEISPEEWNKLPGCNSMGLLCLEMPTNNNMECNADNAGKDDYFSGLEENWMDFVDTRDGNNNLGNSGNYQSNATYKGEHFHNTVECRNKSDDGTGEIDAKTISIGNNGGNVVHVSTGAGVGVGIGNDVGVGIKNDSFTRIGMTIGIGYDECNSIVVAGMGLGGMGINAAAYNPGGAGAVAGDNDDNGIIYGVATGTGGGGGGFGGGGGGGGFDGGGGGCGGSGGSGIVGGSGGIVGGNGGVDGDSGGGGGGDGSGGSGGGEHAVVNQGLFNGKLAIVHKFAGHTSGQHTNKFKLAPENVANFNQGFFYDLASQDDVDVVEVSLKQGDMGVPGRIETVPMEISLPNSRYMSKLGDGLSTIAKMNCNSDMNTTTAIVTQQSPKVINVYLEDELAREKKRQKVFAMAGLLKASDVTVTVASKIPELSNDDMGKVNEDGKMTFGPKYFAAEQVFFTPQDTFAAEEQYIVDHVNANACGICFGKKLLPVLIDHGKTSTGQPMPCCQALGNKSCYNCIMPGHFSSNCEIKKMRFKHGYCSRCMISISMHKENGYGNKCSIQTFDFTWTAAWSVYRNHPLLFKDCVRNISATSGILLSNDTNVCIWLTSAITQQPCALNVTRLVVHLLKRQQVQNLPK